MVLRKHDPIKKEYVCPYPGCGWKFTRNVGKGYSGGGTEAQCVSDHVVCPRCGNFLKTWD